MATAKETRDTIVGIIMLGVIGFFIYSCSSVNVETEKRQTALAASTDPQEIATLVLGVGQAPKVTRIGKTLVVAYKLPEGWSGSWMLSSFNLDATKLIPKLFAQVKDTDEIHIRATADLHDIRGNVSEDLVAKIEVSRANSQRTNWPNVIFDNVPRIVDSYWAHPAMRK